MRNKWVPLLITIVTGISLYIYLFYSHFASPPVFTENFIGLLITIIISNSSIYSILFINTWLDKAVSWKQHFVIRFSLSIISNIAVCMFYVLLFGGGYLMLSNESFLTLFEQYNDDLVKLLILLFFIALVFQSAYFSFYSYHQYAVVQLSKVTDVRNQLKLQFEVLKSQLSPHFLFNSLNTISSLIYKDPDAAEEFIRRLAVTYQYVISTNKKRLVSLENEVEFIRSYYHLLKVRFEDALNLEINLPKNVMNSSIPPLTLQILIENAVKHNQIDKSHPLDIYIGSVDNTYLRVTNSKGKAPTQVKSFKVGLDNIKKRYAFYTPNHIKIEDNGEFTVQLPVIENLKAS